MNKTFTIPVRSGKSITVRHRQPYMRGSVTIEMNGGDLILLDSDGVTALREALDVLTKDRRIQDRRKS